MKVFLSPNGHTNRVSLPLRFGIAINESHQRFCNLENATFDEVGTNQQRGDEIDRGNKRYTGALKIPGADRASTLKSVECSVVLGTPRSSDQAPPIITILSHDPTRIRGDITVTRHIEGMLKSGQITQADLIDVFHPAYIAGEIKDSNDCEQIWRNRICPVAPSVSLSTNDRINQQVAASLASESHRVKNLLKADDLETTDLKAPLTFKQMSIANVSYKYVMADAYIENVRYEGNQIKFEAINTKGDIQTLVSFPLNAKLAHLKPLHEYAFAYLSSRQEQRAKFAICFSGNYRGTVAESVTAIAMQLNRNGTLN